MKHTLAGLVAFAALLTPGLAADGHARVALIRARGVLVCGVAPGVAGFATLDAHGRYQGLDVDICRALAAAIFGDSERVRYQSAASVEQFLNSSDVDVVSRRLTWSLQREGLGLLFGPVMFYDGQGFLVPGTRRIAALSELSGARICVVAGGLSEANLTNYFHVHRMMLRKALIAAAPAPDGRQLDREFAEGHCDAFTADVSELAAIRSTMGHPDAWKIAPGLISKEPLAQVVREGDTDLFDLLRWTVFAMVEAEELGVTSTNTDVMARSDDADVKRLLGVTPGNGKALGLDERWAANVIKAVGNYGEAFERNLGKRSPLKLDRGLNRLWTDGGLMFAPPLR